MISKSFRNFNFKYFSFSISALIFLVLIFGRIGTSLFYPGNLNPDEMQMGANALRIFNYGINLNSIDGTSSGILNSLVLCWPLIFDLNITYVSIRLSALVLIALVTFFTFKILKELSNYYLAIIFILPLVLFYSFTKDPDFLP